MKVLLSGHSLTDAPLGEDLERIAKSLQGELTFEEQILLGSSIRARTAGAAEKEPWNGFRTGRNRHGEGKNILEELSSPRDGRPYDTLIITERHDLAGALVWEETVRYLRHYQDRFIDAHSGGRTYFYESWMSLVDKDRPESWIAYERSATQAWRCVTTRVNATLERAGRSDRIVNVPAGWALAELIERVTQSPPLPGFPSRSAREAVDWFIDDDVHPTRLGMHYMALVTYAALSGRPPEGAWAPEGVTPEQAASLQHVAWESLQSHARHVRPLPLLACREYFRESFLTPYWNYLMRAQFERELGYWRAFFKKTKLAWQWRYRHFSEGDQNPLRDPGPHDDLWFETP